MEYEKFLKGKTRVKESKGIEVKKCELNPLLFDFQKDIVIWALKKGKAAVFADCGLGKTFIQLEWAKHVHESTNKPVVVLAPLAVSGQTQLEGKKFNINVNIISSQEEIINGINITNYEKLDKFDFSSFSGVVLDESSILKSYNSKTRNKLNEVFTDTPFKLCCTATPAPNDYMELANHSQFLDVMTREEMLAMFFTHDGSNTSKWRLKGHAEKRFWQWLANFAVVVSNPADLDYFEKGFDLPELKYKQCVVNGDIPIYTETTLSERRRARRESVNERCAKAVEIAKKRISEGKQVLVWCDLNIESELINKGLGDLSQEIKGATKEQQRIEIINNFVNGDLPALVTKPSIAGFGMNLQNCSEMIFVGLSDSYEKFYQAVRRCWRFGQNNSVTAYIVISAKEGAVLDNIKRKEQESEQMKEHMIAYTKDITKDNIRKTEQDKAEYIPAVAMCLPEWREFYGCTQSVFN